MRRWLYMLGGLGLWAAHFFGVYAIASIADQLGGAAAPASFWAIAAFSIVCAVIAAVVGIAAARQARRSADGPDRLLYAVGALGAAFALLAVLWQGLPALIIR